MISVMFMCKYVFPAFSIFFRFPFSVLSSFYFHSFSFHIEFSHLILYYVITHMIERSAIAKHENDTCVQKNSQNAVKYYSATWSNSSIIFPLFCCLCLLLFLFLAVTMQTSPTFSCVSSLFRLLFLIFPQRINIRRFRFSSRFGKSIK